MISLTETIHSLLPQYSFNLFGGGALLLNCCRWLVFIWSHRFPKSKISNSSSFSFLDKVPRLNLFQVWISKLTRCVTLKWRLSLGLNEELWFKVFQTALEESFLSMCFDSVEIRFRFNSKTQCQMFLLLCGRHGWCPYRHQLGVSISGWVLIRCFTVNKIGYAYSIPTQRQGSAVTRMRTIHTWHKGSSW